MSLYPNLPEAFRMAMRYFVFSTDPEEKKKQDEATKELEREMINFDSEINYALEPVFKRLGEKIKSSGLKLDDEKIKNIKRQVLENMKKYV